ncbi:MAG TPA: phosphoglycerate kinase [Caulobacter sp.]|nr:phosphoglycerate kinase [Caulobacter sp.]
MPFRSLESVRLKGLTALVRVDFNVPMEDGRITDDTRLRAALPTIHYLSRNGARIVLLAHFDRPKGKRVPEMSLKPIVEPLSALLEQEVFFADDCIGDVARRTAEGLEDGGVALMENLRFHAGEEANDPAFAQALAAYGDLYVNDAFSAAHRAHASTEGLARLLPAYPGLAMQRELEALDAALGNPRRPVMGIVGGAKVSTKLDLLNNLVGKLQYLAIGGGMANTFRFAQGYDIAASLCEKDMADTARRILDSAKAAGCHILLPTDVIAAKDLKPGAATRTVELSQTAGGLEPDDKIFDVGPNSLAQLLDAMAESRTLIWNGPLGVFEVPPFDAATVAAARHAAKLATAGKLIAVAGGGDTVSALNHAGVAAEMTFVSTAGGAFLEWMEGKELPGVKALEA